MNSPSRASRPLFLCLLLAVLSLPVLATAQVQVDVRLRRHTFIPYEPIEVILSITNLAGRDVVFENLGDRQWLDLQVTSTDGEREMPAVEPDYRLDPLLVPAGQTLKRAVDIGPHYALRDPGGYRVRASVFLTDADRYFSSNFAAFDLTQGKTIWQQTVGVPLGAEGARSLRTLSLLTHRLPDRLLLYARVRDDAASVTYTTQNLGRLLTSGEEPRVALDRANHLHVLHLAAPRTFLYTEIALDGERVTQRVYSAEGRQHPNLQRGPDGRVAVVNAQVQARPAAALAAGTGPGAPQPATQPRLSDRPAGLPRPVR